MFRGKKSIAAGMAAALTMLTLFGCGSTYKEEEQVRGEEQQSPSLQSMDKNSSQESEQVTAENTAMGRYVEKEMNLSELGYLRGYDVVRLQDETLVVLEETLGKIVSRDNGETWTVENFDMDFGAFTEENYIMDMKMSPEGTTAVLYCPRHKEDISSNILLIGPQGEQTRFEAPAPDGTYFSNLWFSQKNELYAVGFSGSVCRIDQKTGNVEQYLSLVGRPDILKFQGQYMLAMNGETGILLYDMESKNYIEDSVLADFMEQNYKENEYYSGDGAYSVFVFPGEEGVLYVAGKKGLYRHVIGGSAMEQVINGDLSSFNDPSLSIIGMVMLENNRFLTLFSKGKMVCFVYDETVPTVPNEKLTVYSLKDQSYVRQVISLYQTAHPEAYVEYRIGMDGESSITREDAVKNLNTEILAGKGPDVLVLDELPIDSYRERGMLLDLTPYKEKIIQNNHVLSNIVAGFTEENSIFMMPAMIQIPVIAASEENSSNISDFISLASRAEELRSQNPEKEIIGMFSETAAVKWFFPLVSKELKTPEGEIDHQAVSRYLETIKTLYDTCQEGISEQRKELYDYRKELFLTTSRNILFNDVTMNSMEFALGENILLAGLLEGTFSYHDLISMKYINGLETTKVQLLSGETGNVFVPVMLTGINAVSEQKEQAAEFMNIMLSEQAQELLGGEGGFAINEESLKVWLGTAWNMVGSETVAPGEPYSYIGTSSEDGKMFSREIYMPTEEESQELYKMLCSVDVPYIQDKVLEDAVTEAGADYLAGECTLESAVSNIEAKAGLYMAE